MKDTKLRIEQCETILYNANLNPMGVPESVKKALIDNADSIIRYPNDYYGNLLTAISKYSGCEKNEIILGNGSYDLLRLYVSSLGFKKALLLEPSFSEYQTVLTNLGCEIDFFKLKEEENFELNIVDFVSQLDSSYDVIVLGNPNNPTSQLISSDDIETIAEACELLDIFLIIDEMYIEFAEDFSSITSVPLTKQFKNLAIIRSTSKFFAVPGLRLAYSIICNNDLHLRLENRITPNSIATISVASAIPMFSDTKYISESRSQIFTERNLVYSAMMTSKNIKLYRPHANFMLARILKEGVTASQIAEHCLSSGIIIRNCDNIKGLDNSYIRFCFMKPNQNDLLVNTILELL